MSMFSDDQRSWSVYLACLPPEAKCDCGWDRRGECYGSCYGHPEKGGAAVKTEEERRAIARYIAGGPPP